MKNRQKLLYELILYLTILLVGLFILITGKGRPPKKEKTVPTATPYVTSNPNVPQGEE